MKPAVRSRRVFDRAFGRLDWRILTALALLIAAAWMPDVTLPRATWNYMVTFDITQSMNVEDVTLDGLPASRLTLARAALRDALRRMPCGSKVGWSVFTDNRSFPLLLPIEVCGNYEILLSTLDNIDGRMRWANASNIGKGIYWSLQNARAMSGAHIVFITDGQEAPPLRPGQRAMPDIAPDEIRGVGGWLIGVGGDVPSRIPKTDADGVVTGYWAADEVVQEAGLLAGRSQEHLSQLREAYLESLATQTGLGYRRLEHPATLTRAMLDTKWAGAVTRLCVNSTPTLA